MLIATFGPTTGWAGKTITREGDVFTLEGHGPISAQDVMEYDRRGHLVWPNGGTRAWVGAQAKDPKTSRRTPATSRAPRRTRETPAATPDAGAQPPPRRRTYLKRALLIAIALLVVANVALLLVITGVLRGPSTAVVDSGAQTGVLQSSPPAGQTGAPANQATSWPALFAGTWVHSGGSQQEKAVIVEGGGRATIAWTNADGSTVSYAFTGDTLTTTVSGLDKPIVFTRHAPSSDPYVGTYISEKSAGALTETVSFSGQTLSMTRTDAASGETAAMTATLAADGESFSRYESLSGLATVWVRQ